MSFWNILHQIIVNKTGKSSNPKKQESQHRLRSIMSEETSHWKPSKPKVLNRRANIGLGQLCLRRLSLVLMIIIILPYLGTVNFNDEYILTTHVST